MARILQFNFEDKLAQYADRISGSEIVNLAEELHCDTVVIFARDAWGRAYYESSFIRKVSKLGRRDLLREVVAEARKRGIKVVAMVGHTTNPELFALHPDWAQRDKDGRVIHMDTNPASESGELRWPLMCLNSPFLEHVLKEVEEVLRYGVDGVFLDSFRYMPDLEKACFCEYCRKAYREETGEDLPVADDWGSLKFREAFLWRYKVNVRALERVKERVKALKPDAFLVYNSHPAGWKGRANTIVEMARNHIDVVFAEGSEADYQPPGFLAEITKLSQALSGGKRVWVTRNSFHMALTTTTTSPIVMRQGIREIFAAGGEPMFLVFSSALAQAPSLLKGAAQAMKDVERLEEFVKGAHRVRYAGVLYSNRSRDWLGAGDPRHVTDDIRGFYYALAFNGYPVDFIADWQLDQGLLSEYKVVVLPSSASMSAEGVNALENLAGQKAGLIATYLVSLLDERGRSLEEFRLGELLGVSYRGVLKLPWSYVVLEGDHEVVREVPDRVVLWGDYSRVFDRERVPPGVAWHARVEVHGRARAIARIAEPDSEYGFEYENGRSPPLLGPLTECPAIVVNDDKRTVYFSGQLGRLYWRTGLPHYEKLIENAVKWAGGTPPLKVETPGLVLAEPYEKSGQLLIHLVNLTFDRRITVRGNTADPIMWHSSSESVIPPRRVVPVDVEVILFRDPPRRVYSPLHGKKYEVEVESGVSKVRVALGEYEFLVAEY
jgi:hypothetical protein